jgi:hypothetical protein
MSAAGLQLTKELWKNIMKKRLSEMDLSEIALSARVSLVDITKDLYAQYVKRIVLLNLILKYWRC